MTRLTVVLMAGVPVLVAGCAGFRGDRESVACIGAAPAAPPSASPYESRDRTPLDLPGLSMRVWIDNPLRDYDRQVWLFALPMKIHPRNVQTAVVAPGETRVSLVVTARQPGFTFRPREAVLAFGGAQHRASSGHTYVKWVGEGQAERWDLHPIEETWTLPVGEPHVLSLDFEVTPPSPQLPDISLELAEALSAPGAEPLPRIRFAPVRWKEGYT